jgi:hypothetical protein
MINHKLLTLFEGKCWHEWDWKPKDGDIHIYECAKCGLRVGGMPQRNDYSSPNTCMLFLQWLWKERRGMWDAFLSVHPFAWDGKAIPYLFSLIDEGEPRIMVLLSEWLALPETREMWGWEECPYRKEWPRTAKDGGSSFFCEKECKQEPLPCNGTGRVKAEWAIEVKDAD